MLLTVRSDLSRRGKLMIQERTQLLIFARNGIQEPVESLDLEAECTVGRQRISLQMLPDR
jgi:hypothetical protein